MNNFKYYAFISYSHKDQKIVKKLQKKLEHYHLPSNVVKERPDVPKKLRPIFVDESDLIDREGNLTDSLKSYLREAQYLILACFSK